MYKKRVLISVHKIDWLLVCILCSLFNMKCEFIHERYSTNILLSLLIIGKTEKLVYQCLQDLGLPSGKNDTIEKNDFTFDKFYALYHKICPRNDIEELFRKTWVTTVNLYISDSKFALFNYICLHRTQGKAETINLDQFIVFLNEKQRDPRLNEILYPLYDEKRAYEIINTYEQNEEAKATSKLFIISDAIPWICICISYCVITCRELNKRWPNPLFNVRWKCASVFRSFGYLYGYGSTIVTLLHKFIA